MRWSLSNPVWALSSHKCLVTASGSSQWQQLMRLHNVKNYPLRFFFLELMGAKIESFLYLHTLREQLCAERRCLQQGSALWTGSAGTNLKPVTSGGYNSWIGKGKWGRNAQGKAKLWCPFTFISTASTYGLTLNQRGEKKKVERKKEKAQPQPSNKCIDIGQVHSLLYLGFQFRTWLCLAHSLLKRKRRAVPVPCSDTYFQFMWVILTQNLKNLIIYLLIHKTRVGNNSSFKLIYY